MNPEIRFRVPKHVHQLANDRAVELGLQSGKGRTGGASELARGALYAALGLGLPEEMEGVSDDRLEALRAHRPGDDGAFLALTVHHRVGLKYRRESALERGEPVASRATTEFRFPQGQLPHWLIPYLSLTDSGKPFAVLNLEGSLSPRKHVLGLLESAGPKLTLKELSECLERLVAKRERQAKDEAERAAQMARGKEILKSWVAHKGSELLRERLEGGFEWLSLAAEEYSRRHLETLGITEPVLLPQMQSLASGDLEFTEVLPCRDPQLATMKALRRLKELQDPSLEVEAVRVLRRGQTPAEGIRVAFKLPVPGRLHFLTALIEL